MRNTKYEIRSTKYESEGCRHSLARADSIRGPQNPANALRNVLYRLSIADARRKVSTLIIESRLAIASHVTANTCIYRAALTRFKSVQAMLRRE